MKWPPQMEPEPAAAAAAPQLQQPQQPKQQFKQSGVSPLFVQLHKSFGMLVYSVDGRPWEDGIRPVEYFLVEGVGD